MSQSYAKSPAAERKFTTREMVLVGMFAAVLAVISQISLPMPTGVPITIQVFGVALVGAVLGSRLGTTATLVYVLLGAIGLPIFANFSGGISSIVGVTGGYIWAWHHDLALRNPSENREQDKESCNLNRIRTDRTSDR